MRIISASELEGALDYPSLVERLRDMFRRGVVAPLRHHHTRSGDGRRGLRAAAVEGSGSLT